MKYQIVLLKRAKKFIDRLPMNEKRRVVAAIEKLPEGTDVKPLRGTQGVYRLRVGEYRIMPTPRTACTRRLRSP